MKKILLVEDDALLNKTLTYNLISEGYDTVSVLNAGTAAELVTQTEYDLVLLDINLPDGSGYDLCRLIKPENPDTLVIFLTANDQESDQIRGYEAGAVDYITKPFSIGALLRKIRAMFAMLEHRGLAKDFYDDGRLFLDFSQQSASLNGKSLTLSPMEYKMLYLFCKNPKQILTRKRLLERLEQAARLFFPDGDIKIYLSSEQPEEEVMAAGNPLDEELKQEILSVDGVRSVLVTRRSLHAKFGGPESAEAGMCDILTDTNRMDVEAALVSGAMPADAHSILLGTNYQKHHADMDVGATMELALGQETVTVTISGLFDTAKAANGHGALAMDSAALFAPEGLFLDLHPEIESFDYSWSIVSDPKKAESVESSCAG